MNAEFRGDCRWRSLQDSDPIDIESLQFATRFEWARSRRTNAPTATCCRRIGEEGCEWLLAQSIEAAKNAGLMKRRCLDGLVLDTTVQPKAIAHPTDSRLLDRAREQLVGAAKKAGIVLRQSYARVGKHADQKACRYAHAKQFQRVHRKLRTWLGRVIRDVQRKGGEITGALKQKLEIAQRLQAQKRNAKNKLYALHSPEVECLAKGEARTPYEFGVKVSAAVTAKEVLVVGMRSMPGNPYGGYTVDSQLEQVSILTGHAPKFALADRGYRGVDAPTGTRLLISHTRRLPKALKKLLKRRQVGEPMIGHMKADGLLGNNWLKGADGDALHALLCGAGHNLRMLLRYLRVLCLALLAWLASFLLRRTSARDSMPASANCWSGLFRADYRTARHRNSPLLKTGCSGPIQYFALIQ